MKKKWNADQEFQIEIEEEDDNTFTQGVILRARCECFAFGLVTFLY